MAPPEAPDPPGGPEPNPFAILNRRLWIRLAISLALLVAAVALLGAWLREPLTELSELFIAKWGLWGLFTGTIVTDVSPIPLINEPLLLFSHAAGVPFWKTWVVGSSASVGAGLLGYGLGRFVGRARIIDHWIHRSGLRLVMKARGASIVFVAAVTPVPFAASVWTAGACGIPFWRVALACLGRFIKVGFYLTLIALGWAVG
ncbi:MAG: VTT domain-containing protein [Deltaproteobacteria bacterium]|nr:VTT domain-containing protein [Deltaproteobacteria bacterium]